MKIYIETLQKQTIAQNAQLLTWSLFTQEIFQGQDQNRPLANLPVINFLSQPQEMPLPCKATEYPTFCFLLRILVFSPSRIVS